MKYPISNKDVIGSKRLGAVMAFLIFLLCGVINSTLAQVPRAVMNTNEAQGTALRHPQIYAFNVNEVKRLAPGVELNFGIYGTPGGQVSLRIDGANRNLDLIEIEAGQYEGVYTISARDRIVARSQVTANLRSGNLVTSAVLSESLQIGVGRHPYNAASALTLTITDFRVEPVSELQAGEELRFTLRATAGAQVQLSITGVQGKLRLTETNAGEYTLAYIIRVRDRIKSNSEVIVHVTIDDKMISQHLAMPLTATNISSNRNSPLPCRNCGHIEAINVIETRGEGSYLGTIGGGLVGAILGSQVGGGNGRTAAQIAGAVGGAYAGRAIEGNSKRQVHYEVVVRLQSRASQVFNFANPPEFRVGDQVRIEQGRLIMQSDQRHH